jgi:hypothetical protein
MSVERKELAERLRYISHLTERLLAMSEENAEAKELAARISREIEFARDQLKRLPPK